MRLGVFADNNGVIDDDAERHDQRKQADHVDRSAYQIQHRQGRHERNGYADRNPEGHARRQEKIENDQYQYQPPGPIFHQQQDAFLYQLPALIKHLNFNIGR